MSFTEIRFPENISYGSTGGPELSTDIVTTHNGCEQRNINWSRARARYNIAYGVRSNEQLTELITFFQARKGKAIGFRFKDWSDFTVINQEIGIGDDKKNNLSTDENLHKWKRQAYTNY
ncbi:TIGR02217 family protein [Wolbachia endosymbiont of Trichogramma pretiosum]|nr:TIGR02217 family protein [Wolbachia endosymbiont of Trichogramma pretiosum]